jgi:hypothetical protein
VNNTFLLAEGYCQSTADYSLFTLQHGSDFTALLVYADDIILAGTSLVEFQRIKNILDTQFKIKDLGIHIENIALICLIHQVF